MVTSLEKFVFASHLRKPKIRNKAHDFPKPITSQTLLSHYICILHKHSDVGVTAAAAAPLISDTASWFSLSPISEKHARRRRWILEGNRVLVARDVDTGTEYAATKSTEL